MSDILLITPPDKIFNQNDSCLLVFPTEAVRKEASEILANCSYPQNIYLYNIENQEDHDIDWLLSVANFASITVLDIDNCDPVVRDLASYLVSLPKTYWLTQDDKSCYNKLSPNRIWGLDSIKNILGGSIEQ